MARKHYWKTGCVIFSKKTDFVTILLLFLRRASRLIVIHYEVGASGVNAFNTNKNENNPMFAWTY